MKDVQEALDRLVPEPAQQSDWDAVVGEARPRRRSFGLQFAVAIGVAALAALFVVAPWKGAERVGVLDRALAAVGDQPVLHVVIRGDWGGTLVDLETGQRTPLYGEQEIWYDTNRNLVHEISRFGGAVESEETYAPDKKASELPALTREYRHALEAGTARIAGKGTFDGNEVYWITMRRLMLPDVADHKDHEFAEEVAISSETFKPLAIRAMRDRRVFSTERVMKLETVSANDANFTRNPEASLNGRAAMEGSNPVPLDSAAAVLGRTPLWLGPSYAGMPLAQAQKAISRIGSAPVERLVTGERAARIRACLRGRRAKARLPRLSAPVLPCPKTTGLIRQTGDKVYEYGRSTLGPPHTGLTFFYGSVGDEPSTFKKEETSPQMAQPHIVVTQTTDANLRLLAGQMMHYAPNDGSVVVTPGGSGYLIRDGLYVVIQAKDDGDVLAVARALRPMVSSGSGTGG
jgi:hypothetical protein